MISKIKDIFARPFWTNYSTLCVLWLLLGVVSGVTKLNSCNNFKVFCGEFWHVIKQLPIYAPYPAEHFDLCHYGPVFSIIIAPFAALPLPLGLMLWTTALALVLYLSIRHFPAEKRSRIFILWFCAHELLTALFMQQFNIAIAAIIISSYALIRKEKDCWAALLIVIGTFVKLYGVVGLAFFFFSKHKVRFIAYLLLWSAVAVVLPMIISSPEYIANQYVSWYVDIAEKNTENADSIAQNISVLGMAHRISGCQFSDLYIILPAMVLFALPYLRIKQYGNRAFQMTILASVLMFVCLFSSGTESSGYIIALSGVAIWYVAAPWQRSKWDIALMVFAFIVTSMSPSDLFPRYIREHIIQPYALKALPVAVIWLKLCYEVLSVDYKTANNND